MNVLGFDTCFDACSVAVGVGLGSGRARVTRRFERMVTGHAERLAPMMAEALDEAGVGVVEIDRIAITLGPGSFTGTRITIAAARALRLTADLPVAVFSSLEVMAHDPAIGAVPPGYDLLIAVDARRDQIYAQVFDGPARDALGTPVLVAAADLERIVRPNRPVLVAGSASSMVADVMPDVLLAPAAAVSDIANVLEIACVRPAYRGEIVAHYLRPPDAKPQDGRQLERAGL